MDKMNTEQRQRFVRCRYCINTRKGRRKKKRKVSVSVVKQFENALQKKM